MAEKKKKRPFGSARTKWTQQNKEPLISRFFKHRETIATGWHNKKRLSPIRLCVPVFRRVYLLFKLKILRFTAYLHKYA